MREFIQIGGFDILTVALETSEKGGTHYVSTLEVLSKAAQSISEWATHEESLRLLPTVDFDLFRSILSSENFQTITLGLKFFRSWLVTLRSALLPLTKSQLAILRDLLPGILELTGDPKTSRIAVDCMKTVLAELKIAEEDIVQSFSC